MVGLDNLIGLSNHNDSMMGQTVEYLAAAPPRASTLISAEKSKAEGITDAACRVPLLALQTEHPFVLVLEPS